MQRIIEHKSSAGQNRAWKQFLYGQDYYGHPVMYDLVRFSLQLRGPRPRFLFQAELYFVRLRVPTSRH